jgi:hypothetical protein
MRKYLQLIDAMAKGVICTSTMTMMLNVAYPCYLGSASLSSFPILRENRTQLTPAAQIQVGMISDEYWSFMINTRTFVKA